MTGPENSLDLNMKFFNRGTLSPPKLKVAIHEILAKMYPTWLHNLADSVSGHLKECIKRKGKPIKY